MLSGGWREKLKRNINIAIQFGQILVQGLLPDVRYPKLMFTPCLPYGLWDGRLPPIIDQTKQMFGRLNVYTSYLNCSECQHLTLNISDILFSI